VSTQGMCVIYKPRTINFNGAWRHWEGNK